jgi:hypothetical protein
MQLRTRSYFEHKNGCGQDFLTVRHVEATIMVPGASTCCTGCSSTSCCCGALAFSVKED